MKRSHSLLLPLILISHLLLAQKQEFKAISRGTQWEYNESGKDLTLRYQLPYFDETPFYDEDDWKKGIAPFGYGHPEVNTQMSFGDDAQDKHITYYFLHNEPQFLHANTNIDSLYLKVKYNDAFVAYINGIEVARRNLPPLTYSGSKAQETHPANEYEVIDITPFKYLLSPIAYISNYIAVEVHQDDEASSDVFFDMEVSYLVNTSNSNLPLVTIGPYLNLGTENSAVVRWYTNTPTTTELSYGTSALDLNLTYTDDSLVNKHEVKLTDLEPNTKYYYSIDGVPTYVNIPSTQSFRTAPVKNDEKPTRIWVTGDFGNLLPTQFLVYYDYLAKNIGQETDFWMWLGDNAYDKGTFAEYERNVFGVYSQIMKNTMVWPSLGNHDVESCETLKDKGPYFDLFTLPTQGEAGGVASGTEAYYSFDYGNIHFICLESTDNNRMPEGKMLTWLEQDLQANTSKWTVAFWHHPPYSHGSHNSDDEGRLIDMRENANPILEKYGVDLVLTGHSHDYERSYLLDQHYGHSSTFDISKHTSNNGLSGRQSDNEIFRKPLKKVGNKGTVYVVVGSSGSFDTDFELGHPAHYYSSLNIGSMILEISGDTLHASFITPTDLGRPADDFTIVKENQNLICTDDLNLGPDSIVCALDAQLTLSVPFKYWDATWNTGDTTKNITVNKTGSYSVEATLYEGCIHRDTIYVEILDGSIKPKSGAYTWCFTDSLKLETGAGFESYQWSTSETAAVIFVDTLGTYSVTSTGDNGNCVLTDTIVVTNKIAQQNPIISAQPDSANISTPINFSFTADNLTPDAITWDFGNGDKSINYTGDYLYTTPGIYTLLNIAQYSTCLDSTTFIVTRTDESISVQELTNDRSIQIFPNPVSNRLHINLNLKEVDFTVTDTQGKNVSEFVLVEKASEKQSILLVENLPTGVYIISLGDVKIRFSKN